MHKIDRPAFRGEAMLVTGTVIMFGAGLFEWIVVSPDHPGHAVLRVLGAGIAAALLMIPFRKS